MWVWPFLVLQGVIFVGLVLVLRRVLSQNFTNAAAHLQGMSSEYIRRHEELKKQVESAEQQYREQMAQVKLESDRIITQAKQDAESAKAKLLEEARAESERIVQQGMETREALRRDMEQQINARAINRACELIQQVLPGQLQQEIQSRWLDELIQNGLSHLNHVTAQEQIKEVKVVSACPLTAQQRATLRTWLKERLSRDITLTETVDERLVIGLTMTLGSLVLDGSLSSKVQRAAQQARQAGASGGGG